MIRVPEIIKRLQNLGKDISRIDESWAPAQQIVDEAVKALEILGALNGRGTNVPSNWIPCSERLPEQYGEYLCCDDCGNVIIAMPFAERDSDTGYCAESENCYMWSSIAWMPLPAPFEESED